MRAVVLRWPAWWSADVATRQRFTRWLVAVAVERNAELVVVADVDSQTEAVRLATDPLALRDWVAMVQKDAQWRASVGAAVASPGASGVAAVGARPAMGRRRRRQSQPGPTGLFGDEATHEER